MSGGPAWAAPAPHEPPPRRRILRALSAALIVAVALLVTTVLPAEFGVDLLGTGRALGLLDLAGGAESPAASVPVSPNGPLVAQSTAYASDAAEFALLPSVGFVEYHYHMEKGAMLLFEWTATGEVEQDFHAQADGAPPDVAETFAKGRASGGRGSYVAPYTGLHGWYWENKTNDVVRITLSSAGFYDKAVEFRDDGTSVQHDVTRRPPVRPETQSEP